MSSHPIHSLCAAAACALALGGCAVTPAASDQDHAAHHPQGAAASRMGNSPMSMDQQMDAMRRMHEQMMMNRMDTMPAR